MPIDKNISLEREVLVDDEKDKIGITLSWVKHKKI